MASPASSSRILLGIVVWGLLLIFRLCDAACGVDPDVNGRVELTDDENDEGNNNIIDKGALDAKAFYQCDKLVSISLPASLTSIGDQAFMDCTKLKTVTFIDSSDTEYLGLKSIGMQAFANSAIDSIRIPDTCTDIFDKAFDGAWNLTAIEGMNGLRMINNTVFRNTGLTDIIIPESVTSIGQEAFVQSQKLRNVSIGSHVASIGTRAFADSPELTTLTFSTSSGTTALSSIGNYSFSGCTVLPSVTLPNSVTSVGSGAFMGAEKLSDIALPDSLVEIKADTFSGCSSLKSVKLGNSLAEIGPRAFQDAGLEDITIPSNVDVVGDSAFQSCTQLRKVNIKSSTSVVFGDLVFKQCTSIHDMSVPFATGINFGAGSLDYCTSLETITFSRSIVNIQRLPDYLASRYYCPGDTCGCRAGYGNALSDPALFNCESCPLGHSSADNTQEACTACGPGSFADQKASPACGLCNMGKYCNTTGSTSPSTCIACEAGSYAPVQGSEDCLDCPPGTLCPSIGAYAPEDCLPGTYSESPRSTTCDACLAGTFSSRLRSVICKDCPPGNYCPLNGTSNPTKCLAGRYGNIPGATVFLDCPAGSYQPDDGAAFCNECPEGTYSTLVGQSTSKNETCVPCAAGTFGLKTGMSECVECGSGMYQPDSGQSDCIECTTLGSVMTNTPDHTACMENEALLSKSLVDVLFSGGVALYAAFVVSGIYTIIAGVMIFKREQHAAAISTIEANADSTTAAAKSGGVAVLSRWQVIPKAALPGFSFGSELFLIMGIFADSPPLAVVMLSFRLLHVVAIVIVVMCLFGAGSKEESSSCVNGCIKKEDAKAWREAFLHGFAKTNIPFVSAVLILCMGDVSVVQILPWKASAFYRDSNGFPVKSLMRFCLGLDTVQAAVSVLCQITYLVRFNSVNDPTTKPEAKALFGLNISVSVLTMVMGVVMLFLREYLLKQEKRQSEEQGQLERRQTAVVELADAYMDNEALEVMEGVVENPLRAKNNNNRKIEEKL